MILSSLQKISSLFENADKAIECLNELQQQFVIAGSSVIYGCSDNIKKEDVGDIDIFILNSNTDSVKKAINVISTYFTIDQYLILQNSYFDIERYPFKFGNELNPSFNNPSVVTIVINDNINFQIICTYYSSPQEVIDNFDFDYVSAAIHKDIEIIPEITQKSWEHKKIFLSRTNEFRQSRAIKALRKGFKMPIYSNKYEVKPKEERFYNQVYSNLDSIQFVPFKERRNKQFVNFEKLRIKEIKAEGEKKMLNQGICTSKPGIFFQRAVFVLTDGENEFDVNKLVANVENCYINTRNCRDEDDCLPRTDYKNSIRVSDAMSKVPPKMMWVRPYLIINHLTGKIKTKYFGDEFSSDDIIDRQKNIIENILPFDLIEDNIRSDSIFSRSLSDLSDIKKMIQSTISAYEDMPSTSYSSGDQDRIKLSAWKALYYHLFDLKESLIEAGRMAVGQYIYDKNKIIGRSYYPYDMEGKMILPESVVITDFNSIYTHLNNSSLYR